MGAAAHEDCVKAQILVSAVRIRDAWVSAIQNVYTLGLCFGWIAALGAAARIGGLRTLPSSLLILGVLVVATAAHQLIKRNLSANQTVSAA